MKDRIPSPVLLSIIAGTLLMAGSLAAPDVVYAASDPIVDFLKAAKARGIGRAPEVLPPPTRNTKPFRQTVFADCDVPPEIGLCSSGFLRSVKTDY